MTSLLSLLLLRNCLCESLGMEIHSMWCKLFTRKQSVGYSLSQTILLGMPEHLFSLLWPLPRRASNTSEDRDEKRSLQNTNGKMLRISVFSWIEVLYWFISSRFELQVLGKWDVSRKNQNSLLVPHPWITIYHHPHNIESYWLIEFRL